MICPLQIRDSAFTPVFEYASENKLPIITHFGIEISPSADSKFMNPLDLQTVARDYPDIDFVIPHCGAGFLRELLFLFYHVDNVFVDTSGSNVWRKYLERSMELKEVFSRLIDVGGPEKIMFGTDSSWWPRGFRKDILQEQYQAFLENGLSDKDLRLIFRENAKELFNIQC